MASQHTILNPPRGMRDFYPEDMPLRNAIFDTWRKASLQHGFVQYDSCVVESLDLYKRKAGEDIVRQIYVFKDKSGRDLVLRPELTPTLARMVAARQQGLSFPLKWFSIAQCFRYERTTRGRKREHYQWNLDIIGEPSCSAEAEILSAAVRALSLLGLTPNDVVVLVSSRALLSDLFVTLGIPEALHSATFLALDKRGGGDEAVFNDALTLAGLDSTSRTAIDRVLSIATLEDARALMGRTTQACDELASLLSLLDHYGLGDMVQFDISVVRGLGYYTGAVFEAFDTKRNFRAIFGGGRYDNLLGDVGGAPMTGVGLGFGDVVIAELLSSRSDCCATPHDGGDLAVGYMSDEQRQLATRLATLQRANGMSVDLALKPQKARQFFAFAGKARFAQAILIGPDDVTKGTVRIKNLNDRTEHETSLDELLNG